MNTFKPFLRLTRTWCGVTVAVGILAASTASLAVGYVNKTLPSGYTLVANPLDNTTGNAITDLFSGSIGMPGGAGGVVFKWTSPGYSVFYFDGNEWTDEFGGPVGPVSLAVGEGAVVFNAGSSLNNTFVGEVRGVDIIPDPPVRLPVPTSPPGIYLRGSVAPIAPSGFADIMGRAPQDGDAVLKMDTSGNPLLSTFDSGAWFDPFGGNTAPTVGVAESAFFDTTGNQFYGFVLPNAVVVPEPASFSIIGVGLLVASFWQRRIKRV